MKKIHTIIPLINHIIYTSILIENVSKLIRICFCFYKHVNTIFLNKALRYNYIV